MNKKKIIAILLSAAIVTSGLFTTPVVQAHNNDIHSEAQIGVNYQAHVQNLGWQSIVSNSSEAGTHGKSLRLEALKINLINAPKNAKINYQAHVQNQGWQSWKSNGSEAGTEGKSLRAEAIRVSLENLPGYSVQYRVHIQNEGWQPWVSDGAEAGTTGKSLRLEAVEIRIVKNSNIGVSYQAHVQNQGWQSSVLNGAEAGTDGQSLRLEALKISLVNAPKDAKINYQVHVQNQGWQSWKSNGAEAGTEGKSLRTEAIKISLENLPGYSVQYRAHVQNKGWQPWVSDGAEAGTTGKSLRLEAVEIRIVKTSDGDTPIPSTQTFTGYITTEDDFVNPRIGGIDPSSDTKSMILMKTMARSGLGIAVRENNGWKFYYLDGKFATDNNDGADGKWKFDGTDSQLDAWNLVQNTTKASHISVTVTGELTEDKATNTGSDADGIYYPVIKASSIKETSVLNSIAITKPADKLVYSVGDKLDISGLEVTATYSNGSKSVIPITAANVTGFNSSKTANDQILTITAGGKTTTYTVDINSTGNALTLNNISITKPAAKLIYSVGDKLNIAGLEITGTYSDGSKSVIPIAVANITGFDSSKPLSKQVLSINVNGKTVNYTIDVKPKVQTFKGYITTEDDFAANLGEDTAFMVYMKMMALSGLGITFEQDGKWVFYYLDGKIATNNTNGDNGKWSFDGTGSQLSAWKIVEAQVKENSGANKMKPVPVTVTGTLNGNVQTNPGPDADGKSFPVIIVNSMTKN
ncbi:bacterial Ig-like domain-containing protein [Clostridium pasteurianum]|uniref:bacterial Ig-like domain-containing protein n=1 Tax=Clostridium pasteurianum TaxID=1501 RepID=UPI0008DB87B3|nr:bacterial Ig-like domain-containing protein [Clostridium pasteurianum]AOZ80403.1 hypothetical protein AQ984_16385 [Clostridium pasteurianum]